MIIEYGNLKWKCLHYLSNDRIYLVFVVTGLVCSAILKKLSKKAGNVKEQVLSNDLENHSK